MKKRRKAVSVVCFLIAIVAVTGFVSRYIPTRKKMDLNEYYGAVQEGEAALVFGTERLEERGLLIDQYSYLPLTAVNTYLNQRYYWDADNQQILYATPTKLEAVPAKEEAGAPVLLKDQKVYISLDYLKKYTDVDVWVYHNPSRIVIQYKFTDVSTVEVKKSAYIRYRGGKKSEVLVKVRKGDTLLLLEELEDWVHVASLDGYIGYIEKKKVRDPEISEFARTFEEEPYTSITMEEPVNLSWHQVTNMEANAGFASAVEQVSGVNVISPTWFSVVDNSGNIRSLVSQEYVAAAHERGMQVWGLVDNFNEEMSTMEVLSHTASRQNLIQQLKNAALNNGLDGINVDFEYLSEEVGIHFLQFLRELSIECRQNHLVLSVDNPVPENFTSHYDRTEQGRVVDYVIVMGYDEHYEGSDAGSVASLPWVEKGIQDTLREVPAEKIIHAIPFYTRVWKRSAGILSSEAISMARMQEILEKYQVATYWDITTGQNYGKFVNEEGFDCEVWIEDAQSVAEKVKLVPKYQLAGVAHWKLGLESSDVWSVISDNLTAS